MDWAEVDVLLLLFRIPKLKTQALLLQASHATKETEHCTGSRPSLPDSLPCMSNKPDIKKPQKDQKSATKHSGRTEPQSQPTNQSPPTRNSKKLPFPSPPQLYLHLPHQSRTALQTQTGEIATSHVAIFGTIVFPLPRRKSTVPDRDS